MSDLNLLVVIASTRPGRIGPTVARWFVDEAKAHGGFRVAVADLAEENLPLLDEPHHPRLRNYQHDHTKRWSAKVDAADAVVFVMPEYNYGIAAPLKNAIDYLHAEWAYKPASVVTYGGVSAGTRAALGVQQVAYPLHLFVLPESVNIPFVHSLVTDGELQANDVMAAAVTVQLDALSRVAAALQPLRR